jgi:hypothetical protein
MTLEKEVLSEFDIVLSLLYLLRDRPLSKRKIHLALYLASKHLKRFNEVLEFI